MLQNLDDFVRSGGLIIRHVHRDGNCMYKAVADQLKLLVKNWNLSYRDLRKDAVKYMQQNEHMQISGQHFIDPRSWGEYLEIQSQDGSCGDHLVLIALSYVLNRQIKIYCSTRTITLVGAASTSRPICLGHVFENHYVSLWSPDICPDENETPDADMSSDQFSGTEEHFVKMDFRSRPSGKRTNSQHERTVTDTTVSLPNPPALCQLTGDLARYTDQFTHDEIRSKLNNIREKCGDRAVMMYLKSRLYAVLERPDDYSLVFVIKGYLAAAWMTRDNKACFKETKSLAKSIKNYNIRHCNIVHAVLLYSLFLYYLYKEKLGTAYGCIQAAVSNIQTEAPSSWTSRVYYSQAKMYEMLSQRFPKLRKKYSHEAYKSYSIARDHCLCQVNETNVMYTSLYEPIIYFLYMVHIKLDMPTIGTIATNCNYNIMYEHGAICEICESDITEADNMMAKIKKEADTLTNEGQFAINEWIAVADICLSIRKTQLLFKTAKYIDCLKSIKQGKATYKDWENEYKPVKVSRFNRLDTLRRDLNRLMQKLEEDIQVQLQKQYGGYRSPLNTTTERYYSTPNTDSDLKADSGLSDLCDPRGNSESETSGDVP